MSAASQMWTSPTFEVLPNATSSQASLFGPTLFDSPAGPTISHAGPEAVRAQASPVRAKEQGLMTLVTSGRNFIGSSASAALQQSLESNLRTRLDTAGGTLYRLIWKVRHTPLRRRYLVRRVLEVQTRDIACTLSGWPTPKGSASGPDYAIENREQSGGFSLPTVASLAGWPTPQACDSRGATGPASKNADLGLQARLAGWPTPKCGNADGNKYQYGKHGEHILNLTGVVDLCLTPSPMRLKATGKMRTGSSAQMDGGGPLKPEHSRWLMALPSVWDDCAVTAIASMRKSRKRSLRRR